MVFSFFFFFFFFSVQPSESDKDQEAYHIWISGHGTAKFLLADQIHGLANFFLPSVKAENMSSGRFGFYNIVDPKPNKINYFYWGRESNSRDSRWSDGAREEAGRFLFKALSEMVTKNEKKIYLYGALHGGHVIASLIDEIARKGSGLKIEEAYFLGTPITRKVEDSIHRKDVEGQYIVDTVYTVSPEKGFPLSSFDWTTSFPYAPSTFLHERTALWNVKISHERQGSWYRFFHEEANFLTLSTGKNQYVKAQHFAQALASKKYHERSKNPFRWMLYYKKYMLVLFFLFLLKKYRERKNAKDVLVFRIR